MKLSLESNLLLSQCNILKFKGIEMVNLKSLLSEHPELLNLVFGYSNLIFENIKPPEEATPNSICFMSKPTQLPLLESLTSQLLIITDKIWESNSNQFIEFSKRQSSAVITCRNLQVCMAHILNYFDQRDNLRSYPLGISPLSWIDPRARISSDVSIAPFTTIGPNVQIGERTIIGPNCTIEGDVKIGSDCLVESHVFIGRQCLIGNSCRIKPFASIGADGYGYAPTKSRPLKVPQIGIVVLEDYVDVGSSVCIDRATLTQTKIGTGTKIDNLVHIAHNCEIGKYCFLTAGFAMAGSSKIGNHFMTGGASCVGDHVTISDDVTLAGASVVTSDIETAGAFGGNPIQPMQDYLRIRSTITHLPQMRKKINQILKHLGLS